MVDIKDIIEQNIAIKRKMVEVCIEPIEKAADLMIDAIMNGKKYYGVVMVVLLPMPSICLQN